MATCTDCEGINKGNKKGEVDMNFCYIGEYSCPLRIRARENWENLNNLNLELFMLTHWMQAHGLQMVPPNYTFKIIGVYKDYLSRQVSKAIQIEHKGILNKRSEFGINHIPRLVADKTDRDRDLALFQESLAA